MLYTTSARIGGSGLDSVVFESLKGLSHADILARAIAYGNRQTAISKENVRTLEWHPVRLLSFLESPYYYGAKKKYLDWVASRDLATSPDYDFFHGWSGDSLLTLREAKRRGIPSVLEIPTWHRNKGKHKPWMTRQEEQAQTEAPLRRWRSELLVSRQRVLEEYDLADLIFVLSEKAIETFLAAGIPRERLYKVARGVDPVRFTPSPTPPFQFKAIFVGALIKRKGVHHLLEAWKKLNLKDAELTLVGSVHEEIQPYLKDYSATNVRVAGFAPNPELLFNESNVHILPSSCEGSAKTTYEAAACGLAQITTRESGDVVIDGSNGLIIPPGDTDALAEAILALYNNPSRITEMGHAGRKRVVEEFTWDHFRERLLEGYRVARERAQS